MGPEKIPYYVRYLVAMEVVIMTFPFINELLKWEHCGVVVRALDL